MQAREQSTTQLVSELEDLRASAAQMQADVARMEPELAELRGVKERAEGRSAALQVSHPCAPHVRQTQR